MKKIKSLDRLACGLVLFALLSGAGSALAQFEDPTPFASPTPLTPINGWTNAPFGTSDAEVEKINGIVHFKGAIATDGANAEPFVLPDEFRPAHDVYVPVDMCGATNGRLIIYPSGKVIVEAETSFSNAACFTSLDGASFVLSGAGFTPLKLIDGWTNDPSGTGNAGVANIGGIVHFKGAVTGGAHDTPFALPKKFRPSNYWTYTSVDLCNAHHGMLMLGTNGNVYVDGDTDTITTAQCFTSLDGAWFALTGDGFKPLSLINGWTNGEGGTSNAEVAKIDGIVYFKGGISSGTDAVPFVLPKEFRPVTNVYVSVALQCGSSGAYNVPGRLYIKPNGVVRIQETGFSIAQCLTSLDGASFVQ